MGVAETETQECLLGPIPCSSPGIAGVEKACLSWTGVKVVTGQR
jgi:hypothetical protein